MYRADLAPLQPDGASEPRTLAVGWLSDGQDFDRTPPLRDRSRPDLASPCGARRRDARIFLLPVM